MTKAEIVLSAVDKTKAAIDSAKRNLAGLEAQATRLPAAFGTLGAAIAGAITANTLKGVVDLLDRLDDMSEKTGVSVERLSELRYAGEVTGTSFEALAGGMRKLVSTMSEAARGGKEQAATFEALGVRVRNADGSLRSVDDVLADVADRFAGWEDGPEKGAIAMRLFGKSGEELIPILNQGSIGLARLADEARRLGVVYSGDLAKQAADFNDNLARLKLNAEGATVALVGDMGLLPALNRIAEGYLRMREQGLMWTIIKDAAKGVVGLNKLTDDPDADLATLSAERARLQKNRNFAERRGLATRDIEDDLFQNDLLLQVTRTRREQRRKELDKGDNIDAGGGWNPGRGRRTGAPIVKGTGDAAAIAAREAAELSMLQSLQKEYENLAGSGTKLGEVLAQLTGKGAEFSKATKDEAKRLASLIDAWRARQKLLESENAGLAAQSQALEEGDEAWRSAFEAVRRHTQALGENADLVGMLPEEVERTVAMLQIKRIEDAAHAAALDGVNKGLWTQAEGMRRVAAATRSATEARDHYDRLVAERDRRAFTAAGGVDGALRDYRQTLKREGDAAADASNRIIGGIEDGLLTLATTGKLSVRGLVDTILVEFARLRVIRPMMAEFFGPGGYGAAGLQMGLGSGWLAGTLRGAFGAATGGGDVGGRFGPDNIDVGGGWSPTGWMPLPVMHTGGIVGAGSATMRNLSASVFDHAMRYHTGGIAGNEVPTILERGEGVFTREQMKALGGRMGASITMPVSINVDSRSDRAQVIADVHDVVSRNNKLLVEQLTTLGVIGG